MTYTDQHAEARKAFLQSLDGLTYSASFVPQSLSRNAGEKAKTLNWRIRIARGGTELVTDYMQGIGHVPFYPQNMPRTLYLEGLHKAIEGASETGKYPASGTEGKLRSPLHEHKHEHGTRLDVDPWYKLVPLPAPDMEDVLHSLVLDASACRMTFDEWCDEYGYDTDSRKAHAAYTQCADIGLKLVRMVGGADKFATLEELYSDF